MSRPRSDLGVALWLREGALKIHGNGAPHYYDVVADDYALRRYEP